VEINDEKFYFSREIGGLTGAEQIQADEHCECRLPA
jgi:hypothetical protein